VHCRRIVPLHVTAVVPPLDVDVEPDDEPPLDEVEEEEEEEEDEEGDVGSDVSFPPQAIATTDEAVMAASNRRRSASAEVPISL
jgi:hypothetical protein